jgi:hypothetical protein
VLFDLYRAIGQQHKFESLALDYAQQFGWSAPQWFSMPKLVAEARQRSARDRAHRRPVGWISPLTSIPTPSPSCVAALQMPLPWVFDWSAWQHRRRGLRDAVRAVPQLDPAGAGHALAGGETPVPGAAQTPPTGVRDVDPAFWQVRLDALRMANRPDQFDEAAIDYCVTYEVSPPSWETSPCQVRVSGSRQHPPRRRCRWSATCRPLRRIALLEDTAQVSVGTVELSGQLVGDIGAT